jgi:thiamine transport system permease protein
VKIQTRYLLAGPPLLFLAVFYFYPLISIFGLSFAPQGAWETGWLYRLAGNSYYLRVLWFTTWQAGLSTLLTLIIALPGAYVFAHYEFRGKALIQALITVPFILPTVVTAAAFRALLGPGGLVNTGLMAAWDLSRPPINIDHTVWFFLLAHVFYNYTVIVRLVGGFWARLPRDVNEAATMLGASRSQVFLKVTLPLLMPAVLAASLLIFVFCFTSFGVVLILGGPRLATVEVEIYRQAVHLFNLPMAAALSLVQIIFIFGLMWLYTRLERRTAVSLIPTTTRRDVRASARTRFDRLMIGGTIMFLIFFLGAPLMALLLSSLMTGSGPGLTYYLALFENKAQSILYVAPITAMANSLGFALAATVIALILGGCSAAFLAGRRSRLTGFFDPVFMLPLATSAVTLGFGFIIALDEPPLNLRTSLLLPAIAHALVAFPFVIRSLLPAWRGIPQSLREAAAVLGAAPIKVWQTVDWPVLSRALMVGAMFAFAISMGEFGATVFVARPQTPTMPLAIYRYLTHPGAMNYGQAMAMSCILMVTTAIGFVLLEKIRFTPGDY